MAEELKSFRFLFLILIFSSAFFAAETRPLKPTATGDIGGSVLNWLSLKAVKAGPSPGEGHKFINADQTLGGIKNSGPSPGAGHKLVN